MRQPQPVKKTKSWVSVVCMLIAAPLFVTVIGGLMVEWLKPTESKNRLSDNQPTNQNPAPSGNIASKATLDETIFFIQQRLERDARYEYEGVKWAGGDSLYSGSFWVRLTKGAEGNIMIESHSRGSIDSKIFLPKKEYRRTVVKDEFRLSDLDPTQVKVKQKVLGSGDTSITIYELSIYATDERRVVDVYTIELDYITVEVKSEKKDTPQSFVNIRFKDEKPAIAVANAFKHAIEKAGGKQGKTSTFDK